jgi:hypothetical protein
LPSFSRILNEVLHFFTLHSGGHWEEQNNYVEIVKPIRVGFEGQKHVCLDAHFLEKASSGNCLVYSFGLSDDWDFEEFMAELGCTVRAFDPTVDQPENL